MLTIVSFKWMRPKTGDLMPSQEIVEYGSDHVLIHKRMFERHLKIPHRYVCITDTPINGVECLPLWDKCKNLGRCYNRLYSFSKDMHRFIGQRFACVDLDCVLLGDVTPIFDRPSVDFIMNSYKPVLNDIAPDQFYNGGMFMMDAGARAQVWDDFCPRQSPQIVDENNRKRLSIGSDQAWIRHVLGKSEARWTESDGVYEARQIRYDPPENARIVFFAGKRDPSKSNKAWIKENWK